MANETAPLNAAMEPSKLARGWAKVDPVLGAAAKAENGARQNRGRTGLVGEAYGAGDRLMSQTGGAAMQRKEIDEVGFAIIETELVDKQVLPGDIAVVIGRHDQHGRMVLIQAGGLYLALADDVGGIIGLDEPIEGDA